MSTKERIKQEARRYTEGWGENCDIKSFEAGALSERNKTIEQMEAILTRVLSTSSHLPEVLKNLESLKV